MSLKSTKRPSCGAHWSQLSVRSGLVTATCRTQHRKRHTTQMFDARCHYNSTPRRLHRCTVERVAIAPPTLVDHIAPMCHYATVSLAIEMSPTHSVTRRIRPDVSLMHPRILWAAADRKRRRTHATDHHAVRLTPPLLHYVPLPSPLHCGDRRDCIPNVC